MSDKYMKNLTFANIAKACDGTYIGDETLLDTTITGAVIDSRQVDRKSTRLNSSHP